MERAYEKQLMQENEKAKRSLGIEEGSNGGQGRLRKKVTDEKSYEWGLLCLHKDDGKAQS